MPTTYTPPTSTPPETSYELPNDGEEISFASLMTAILEPLAYGIAYLGNNIAAGALAATNAWTGANSFDNITATAGHSYKVSSRAETRTTPLLWVRAAGAFTEGPLAFVDDATGGVCAAMIDLPHGQTLTGLSLFIDPIAHAALPAVMPSWNLKSIAIATGVASAALVSKTDATVLGSYSSYHAIEATGAAVTIDTSANVYYITYTNESGADDEINTSLASMATYTIQRTTIGED